MTRRKKGGNKGNNKPEDASSKPVDTSNQKKDGNISACGVQEIYKPSINFSTPTNSPQHVTEKKLKKDDNGKSDDAFHATKQPVGKPAANLSEKTTIKDNADNTCENQASGSSKKKRNRRRGKSTLDNSISEPVKGAERKVPKPTSSKTSSGKDTDRKLDCNIKVLENFDLVARRISQLESNSYLSIPLRELSKVTKNRSSPAGKEKKENTNFTKGEEIHLFSKDDGYFFPKTDFAYGKIKCPLRPIIKMTHQTTQTDPIQDPPSSFEPTNEKNRTVPKSDSNIKEMNEQKKSTLQSSIEEIKSENASEYTDKPVSFSDVSRLVEKSQNTDGKPESLSISESNNCKIGGALKADSVKTKPNESTLLFSAEEKQPENVSEDTHTFLDKHDSFSNLSSFDKTFKITTSIRTSKRAESEPQSISKSIDDKDITELADDKYSTEMTEDEDRTKLTDKDGTELTDKDGTELTDKDGTELTDKGDTELTDKGDTELTDKGDIDLTDKDGTGLTDKDGSELIDDKDGSELTDGKDGSELTDGKDGSELTDDKDGSKLTDDIDTTELTDNNDISKLPYGKDNAELTADKNSAELTLNKPSEVNTLFDEKSEPPSVSDLIATFQNKIDSVSNVRTHKSTRQSFISTSTPLKSWAGLEGSTSKSTDDKNSTALKSDLDGSVVIEQVASASNFQAEGTKPESDSEHVAAFQNQVDSFSNTTSPDVTLQALTKEFLENLETKMKELEKKLMQHLKYDK